MLVRRLRDDLIFAIFLYQRYIYRVDSARPDEFGYKYKKETGKDEEGASGESARGEGDAEGAADQQAGEGEQRT